MNRRWQDALMADVGSRFDRDFDRPAITMPPHPCATDGTICGLFSTKDCPLEWHFAFSQENDYDES